MVLQTSHLIYVISVKVHKKGQFSGYGQKSDSSTGICASGLNPEFWSKAHLRMKKCIGSSSTIECIELKVHFKMD